MYVPFNMVYVCLLGMIVGSGSIVPARIVTATLINHKIESDERATVLSVKHMVEKSFSGVGMMFLKPLFDNILFITTAYDKFIKTVVRIFFHYVP